VYSLDLTHGIGVLRGIRTDITLPSSSIPDDDDVYLKKNYNEGVTKSNHTHNCRPAKGISKRVNIQIKIQILQNIPNDKGVTSSRTISELIPSRAAPPKIH
jgi:hypothetical protein